MAERSVVLLSGGLDSATVLAISVARGYESHTVSFDYGQRHRFELSQSEVVSRSLGAASHRVVKLDSGIFSGSSLTGNGEPPEDRDGEDMASGIPSTFVPARNLVFLSLAASFAASISARRIFIGANQVDYSGYPDCRMEFLSSFEDTCNIALRGHESSGVIVEAPLVYMAKEEIIRIGSKLGVDYAATVSCYNATSLTHCGKCDSCYIRRNGFIAAGLQDPTEYRAG